jgi:hypothetical protein
MTEFWEIDRRMKELYFDLRAMGEASIIMIRNKKYDWIPLSFCWRVDRVLIMNEWLSPQPPDINITLIFVEAAKGKRSKRKIF